MQETQAPDLGANSYRKSKGRPLSLQDRAMPLVCAFAPHPGKTGTPHFDAYDTLGN